MEIRVSLIFPILFWLTRRLHPALSLGVLAGPLAGLPFVRHGNYFEGEVINPAYVAMFVGGILLWLHLPWVSRSLHSIGAMRRGVFLLISFLTLEGPHAMNAWFGDGLPQSILNLEEFIMGVGGVGLWPARSTSDVLLGFSTTRFLFAWARL